LAGDVGNEKRGRQCHEKKFMGATRRSWEDEEEVPGKLEGAGGLALMGGSRKGQGATRRGGTVGGDFHR